MTDHEDLGPLPRAERSNELERECIAELQRRLPVDRLVFRREGSDDFGVDGALELLVGGFATNFRADAQLKATDHPQFNRDGTLSLAVDVSNLNYLLNGLSPIYLLYVAPMGEIFYAWGQDEKRRIETSSSRWREQKTVVVRFARRMDVAGVDDICERIREESSIRRSLDGDQRKGKQDALTSEPPEQQARAKEFESERARQIEESRAYSKQLYEEKKKAKPKLKRHWEKVLDQKLSNRELEGFANKLQFFDVHEIMEAISIAASKELDSYVPYVHGILNRWRDAPASRSQVGRGRDSQPPATLAVGRRTAKQASPISTASEQKVTATLPPFQQSPDKEEAGERSDFFAMALFEDLEPSEPDKRYTLVRWHMLNFEDGVLDASGAESCSFPYFHMAAAHIPPSSIPLESMSLDAKMRPQGCSPLREMQGYVTSWMVSKDDMRSHDPQAAMERWVRGTKDEDIQKHSNPKGMYILGLWVHKPTNNEHDLRGYLVCRAKIVGEGEEPKFQSRGTWHLHEAISWLPSPTLMMPDWRMYADEKDVPARRFAMEDKPIATWYAPTEVVEEQSDSWGEHSGDAAPQQKRAARLKR
ncbi:DUF4365 domain-containing protein [Stigmatella aurantiaca]|nr:DUF4365 domain-containing protein [Stigmatella aurantiaca]ADO70285.1 uncharacterized protein STAUR_2481 [Stigmatella aurantiaca DW4/3-1]